MPIGDLIGPAQIINILATEADDAALERAIERIRNLYFEDDEEERFYRSQADALTAYLLERRERAK